MMADEKRFLFRVAKANGELHGWAFHCPGCNMKHVYDQRWTFNGDQEQPTFTPSYLAHKNRTSPRCHLFVTDGQIKFLGDCTHELAGTTVPMVAYDWSAWGDGSSTDG